jgi:RNA polymerase sigma-70 factor, ECF subfamily
VTEQIVAHGGGAGSDRPAAPGDQGEPRTQAEPRAQIEPSDDGHEQVWRLVHAAQNGDTKAFGELYDRYVDVVHRYVLFRLGDRSLAEDLTSETFLRALRRISSVSYQGRDVGAWFITIARNLVLDHVKSSRYRLEVITADVADSPSWLAGVNSGPEHDVIAAAIKAELMRCIDKLNKDQQECIRLRFLQGLSVAETAAHMGRNEGAIKALQHRAVRRLAQLLPEGLL